MYGKTDGLNKRIKLRGEYQLSNSIIFGASYSFEPTSSDIEEKNQDIFRSYIKFPISIKYINNLIK